MPALSLRRRDEHGLNRPCSYPKCPFKRLLPCTYEAFIPETAARGSVRRTGSPDRSLFLCGAAYLMTEQRPPDLYPTRADKRRYVEASNLQMALAGPVGSPRPGHL